MSHVTKDRIRTIKGPTTIKMEGCSSLLTMDTDMRSSRASQAIILLIHRSMHIPATLFSNLRHGHHTDKFPSATSDDEIKRKSIIDAASPSQVPVDGSC
jgi:hypothetical protein